MINSATTKMTFFNLIFCLACLLTPINGTFFFTPHNNITILQSAVYQCTVSEVGPGDTVNVAWNVNGVSSSSPSWDSYISSVGIVADGIGTYNTTLTIPGDPKLNGTTVTCTASGLVNGTIFRNIDNRTIYIQDKPDGVSLQCAPLPTNHTYIQCNWTVPYTIHGVDITGYRINSSGIPQVMIIQQTQYTYSICEYRNISVAAVIGELEGEIDSYTPGVVMDLTNKLNSSTLSEIINNTLYTNLTLKDPKLCGDQLPNRIILISTTDDDSYSSADVIKDSDDIISGVFMDINKGRLNYTVTIEYGNGAKVKSVEYININTFDVQDMILSSSDNTTGHVCFNFTYINGLTTQQAFFEYDCAESKIHEYLYINNKSYCTTISSSHTYTVKAYDIESSNSIYPTPAVVITTVLGRVTPTTSVFTTNSTVNTTIPSRASSIKHIPFIIIIIAAIAVSII